MSCVSTLPRGNCAGDSISSPNLARPFPLVHRPMPAPRQQRRHPRSRRPRCPPRRRRPGHRKTSLARAQSAWLEDDPFVRHADGICGRRFYVYCGSGGVAGISAKDGTLLWETAAWKISIATVPSRSSGRREDFPVRRLQCRQPAPPTPQSRRRPVPETVWKLGSEDFGATQHTPIFHDGRIYGTRPNGQFVCLGLDGRTLWASPPGDPFGLGPFLFADGLFS